MRLLGLLVCACCATAAMAGVAPGVESGTIQATLAPDGSGSMLANVPTGHRRVSYTIQSKVSRVREAIAPREVTREAG